MKHHDGLTVRKQDVLELLEPHITVETIGTAFDTNAFNMYKMGHFEYDCEEYIFGTEEHQYKSSMRRRSNPNGSLPIVIAKVQGDFKKPHYLMVPTGTFSQQDLSIIQENIDYTFACQKTAIHYCPTRC